MTLFEALVALVILGLASVGIMGAYQVTSQSVLSSEEWVQAVSYAEAAMEGTKLVAGSAEPAWQMDGYSRKVATQPWGLAGDLHLVTVEIGLPRGGTFTLQRLGRLP